MELLNRALLVISLLAPTYTYADLADSLREYIGYTIADVKTISGSVDKDGKQSDSFEGCNYGRQIVFDDGTALTCSTYRYQYAYRPKAVILMQATATGGGQFASVVMIVGEDNYSMQGFLLK